MSAQHSAGKPIATLSENDLPKRARNALLRSGIATLEDAAEWSDRDLLSRRIWGKLMWRRCGRW